MGNNKIIDSWRAGVDYPEWMDENSLTTLNGGYLLTGETPKDAIQRVSRTASKILNKPELETEFFQIIWNGWFCLSTPIWSNFGTTRGLPISCYGSYVEDSIKGIFDSVSEVARMSQLGGGTSAYFGALRPRGSKIGKNNGRSDGSKQFVEIFDKVITKISQGSTRRGALAVYLDVEHKDIEEFLQIKDVGDSCQNVFTGVNISNKFIEKLYEGDEKAWSIWAKILKSRSEKGLPYIFFTDNVNNGESTPNWYGYKQTNPDLHIKASNLCTEICEPSNDRESFVCCVASMNLAKWSEWQHTNTVQLATYFLDAVTTEFIDKTKGDSMMWKARNFAKNHRALGLGVLGLHTYLQENDLPFTGLQADSFNRLVFKHIREQAELATAKLGLEYGPCKIGDGIRRNSTLIAPAPTVSNATIMGKASMFKNFISSGIEPYASNFYIQKSAKGNFTRKNKKLESLLMELGKNTDEVWDTIKKSAGSVQHLEFLTEDQREIFKTFKEINQFEIVRQASIRQKWIDQSQSLNLNIPPDTDPKTISKLYLYAHALGIKTLYYQRSESTIKGGVNVMDAEACASCAG